MTQVRVPTLAINGSLDLQVPAKPDLDLLAANLAGDRDVTIRELPGLNHLFQSAKTGSPAEYGTIDETIAPSVLDLVTGWVHEKVRG